MKKLQIIAKLQITIYVSLFLSGCVAETTSASSDLGGYRSEFTLWYQKCYDRLQEKYIIGGEDAMSLVFEGNEILGSVSDEESLKFLLESDQNQVGAIYYFIDRSNLGATHPKFDEKLFPLRATVSNSPAVEMTISSGAYLPEP